MAAHLDMLSMRSIFLIPSQCKIYDTNKLVQVNLEFQRRTSGINAWNLISCNWVSENVIGLSLGVMPPSLQQYSRSSGNIRLHLTSSEPSGVLGLSRELTIGTTFT